MNKKNNNNLKPATSYQSIKIGEKEAQTTAFNDLRLAEYFGTDAIKDTYNNLCLTFGDIKTNSWYYIELMYVLNQLSWLHYDWDNIDYSYEYMELFYKLKRKYLDDATPEMVRLYFDYID